LKTFILDTNVLIHDPEALFTFEGSKVVIPLTVVEELDGFKKSNDNRGRSARTVSRFLDELRHHGKLTEGAIHSLNGGSTKLRYGPVTREVKLSKGEVYRCNGQ